MADNKQGKGSAKRDEGGLIAAIDAAWEDAKNHGAKPDDTLTIQQIQVQGNNPIHTYIVYIGP
jgi:hypothetical protein